MLNDACAAGLPVLWFVPSPRSAQGPLSAETHACAELRETFFSGSTQPRNVREMHRDCLLKACRIAQTVAHRKERSANGIVRFVLAAISYGTEQALLLGQWARRVGCILAPLRLSCCAVASFKTTHFPVLDQTFALRAVRCAVQRCGAVRSVAGSASAVALLHVWSQSVGDPPGPHQAHM
jgi:hypothetical protein